MTQALPLLNPPVPAAAGQACDWGSLPITALALATANAARAHTGLVFAIAGDERQAYRIERELRFFAGSELPVLHLPDTEVLPYDQFSPHQEILSDRLAALYALPTQTRGIVLATADALIQRLPPRQFIDGQAVMLQTGDKLDPQQFRRSEERRVGKECRL